MFSFGIEQKLRGTLCRAGVIRTSHGEIKTPAFVPVGTLATVKSLTPAQIKEAGAQAVLANTYHLYLQPGPEALIAAGGLSKFMGWDGPTMTDSGGFQVFSLGSAFGKGISKFSSPGAVRDKQQKQDKADDNLGAAPLARVDEDGVTFRSHRDGSEHRFTPERSIAIEHGIGADIIFAFDECPASDADHAYQRQAMERTHRWAARSLAEHQKLGGPQALYGIVQGGRFEDLRRESARTIATMPFDGFGIGGSFDKKDVGSAVRWVNEILPEEKPRHLLGIGEPEDLFLAIENGCDTFDCVAPTRLGRTGLLYTERGKLNIKNSACASEYFAIQADCACYTCATFTRAYLHHLFDAKEMLAATLATIHNLHFLVSLMERIRESIIGQEFTSFKERFTAGYAEG